MGVVDIFKCQKVIGIKAQMCSVDLARRVGWDVTAELRLVRVAVGLRLGCCGQEHTRQTGSEVIL